MQTEKKCEIFDSKAMKQLLSNSIDAFFFLQLHIQKLPPPGIQQMIGFSSPHDAPLDQLVGEANEIA